MVLWPNEKEGQHITDGFGRLVNSFIANIASIFHEMVSVLVGRFLTV